MRSTGWAIIRRRTANVGDRAGLETGTIVQTGTPKELTQSALINSYLGNTPKAN